MHLLGLAIPHITSVTSNGNNTYYEFSELTLKAFTIAVIEDYMASLVEVYGIIDDGTYVGCEESELSAERLCYAMNQHDGCLYSIKPLYALPIGESK